MKSDKEKLAEELGFEDVDYEDVLNQDYSTFCKMNPNSFTGSKHDKCGYIIGPTFTQSHNDEDENTTEHYEIFWPKVYVTNKMTWNSKQTYRFILFQFENLTYAIFLEDNEYKKPEEYYRKLQAHLIEKSKSMISKLDPIVEYNDENPFEVEEEIKFMYFNQMNLAIKQSPRFTKKVLTNELKHLLNVIKTKFTDNPSLSEYQITATDYWVIARHSEPRIIIALLPISLSQPEAEQQAKIISDKYFLIF